MNLPSVVIKHITDGALILKNCSSKNRHSYMAIDLNCANFPQPTWIKGAPLPNQIQTLLTGLPNKKIPALYYFEIISSHSRQSILNDYIKMKNDINIGRACPALKKDPPTNTDILHVGKVKNDILGRVTQHLGYYYNKNTSCLQLACWAKAMSLDLKLHIFSFKEEVSPYISTFELPFSKSLNPMIGKQ